MAPKAFRVPRAATAMKRLPSKADNHKNVFATTASDPCPATTLLPASAHSDVAQIIDLQIHFYLSNASPFGIIISERGIPCEDSL